MTIETWRLTWCQLWRHCQPTVPLVRSKLASWRHSGFNHLQWPSSLPVFILENTCYESSRESPYTTFHHISSKSKYFISYSPPCNIKGNCREYAMTFVLWNIFYFDARPGAIFTVIVKNAPWHLSYANRGVCHIVAMCLIFWIYTMA